MWGVGVRGGIGGWSIWIRGKTRVCGLPVAQKTYLLTQLFCWYQWQLCYGQSYLLGTVVAITYQWRRRACRKADNPSIINKTATVNTANNWTQSFKHNAIIILFTKAHCVLLCIVQYEHCLPLSIKYHIKVSHTQQALWHSKEKFWKSWKGCNPL